MIDKLKPYPATKDSGVPWLGEVPEQWRVQRIKTLFRERDERSGNGSGVLLSLTRARGLLPQSEASSRLASAADLSKYKMCRPGDLVMNRMQAWSGMFAASACEGLVSPDYSVFAARTRSELRFFEALFKTPVLVEQFAQASKGIGSGFNRLYTPDFGAVPVAIPPLPEQVAIIRFLDHADRRIRRYIRAKQKLIKLLEEQKQAIIHRAVTRGLDPKVRLKPSGVEWLGDVPEHWEVVPLKFLSERIQNGATPSTSEVAFYENGTIPWYGPSSCAQGESVRAPVRYLAEVAFTAGRARLIHYPALLVIVIGATAGRMALLLHEGATNQQITTYELRRKRVSPRFVLHQLRGAEGWLRSTASTATIPILDGNVVSRLSVAIPSVTEQEAIVCSADDETTGLAMVIDRARREIELLREYHTSLIADVVTGKLDVRFAAARLPDEAEETEPLDDIECEGDTGETGADDDAVPEEAEA